MVHVHCKEHRRCISKDALVPSFAVHLWWSHPGRTKRDERRMGPPHTFHFRTDALVPSLQSEHDEAKRTEDGTNTSGEEAKRRGHVKRAGLEPCGVACGESKWNARSVLHIAMVKRYMTDGNARQTVGVNVAYGVHMGVGESILWSVDKQRCKRKWNGEEKIESVIFINTFKSKWNISGPSHWSNLFKLY